MKVPPHGLPPFFRNTCGSQAMTQEEAWDIGRLLTWTTEYLGRHGSDSPRLDAEILLAEALGCRRIELYTAFDRVPSEKARTRFRELVRRRAAGMPVAHLVGGREFYSLSFRVTPDVLIPRPETEFVVVDLLDLARREERPLDICDVGTGSGVLAVCAARHLPQARVVAIDVSPAALQVAETNARDHSVADRVTFLESDLLAALPAEPQFDFIVSNPPYVSDSEMEQLPSEVRDHEPWLALQAGPAGTSVIEKLLPQAAARLRSGGHLLVEISPMIHEAVSALIDADPRWQRLETTRDLARHPRVVRARRTGRQSV